MNSFHSLFNYEADSEYFENVRFFINILDLQMIFFSLIILII